MSDEPTPSESDKQPAPDRSDPPSDRGENKDAGDWKDVNKSALSEGRKGIVVMPISQIDADDVAQDAGAIPDTPPPDPPAADAPAADAPDDSGDSGGTDSGE